METNFQPIDLVDSEPDRRGFKTLRTELREARFKNSLPRQEELAELAIGFCIDILTNWKDRCVCDMQYSTDEERQNAFQKRGGRSFASLASGRAGRYGFG